MATKDQCAALTRLRASPANSPPEIIAPIVDRWRRGTLRPPPAGDCRRKSDDSNSKAGDYRSIALPREQPFRRVLRHTCGRRGKTCGRRGTTWSWRGKTCGRRGTTWSWRGKTWQGGGNAVEPVGPGGNLSGRPELTNPVAGGPLGELEASRDGPRRQGTRGK
jgi:hypothetical protein